MSEASNTPEIKTAFGWRPVHHDVTFGWSAYWLTLEIYGRTHWGAWRFGDHESSGCGYLYT